MNISYWERVVGRRELARKIKGKKKYFTKKAKKNETVGGPCFSHSHNKKMNSAQIANISPCLTRNFQERINNIYYQHFQ